MKNNFIFFMILYSFTISASVLAETERREFATNGIRELTISNRSGNIAINSAGGPKATVQITKNKFSVDDCKLSVDQVKHQLAIKVEATGVFSTSSCDVDFAIQVPSVVDLDLKTGSGDVSIKGIKGSLDFNLGSGNLVADGTFKKMAGHTGSGRLNIDGSIEDGDLKTGSGNISIRFASRPSAGQIQLQTGSGDGTILFPKGSKIKTTFTAGSGEMTNDLHDQPNAHYFVSMKAGSGNLKIQSY